MGWGGLITFFAVRSLALARIRNATLLCVLLDLRTYIVLRCCNVLCTHTSCYTAVFSLALAHIRPATLLYVILPLHTHTSHVMLLCCTFSCTCTHTSCYAAVPSLALAHIRHATLVYVFAFAHVHHAMLL